MLRGVRRHRECRDGHSGRDSEAKLRLIISVIGGCVDCSPGKSPNRRVALPSLLVRTQSNVNSCFMSQSKRIPVLQHTKTTHRGLASSSTFTRTEALNSILCKGFAYSKCLLLFYFYGRNSLGALQETGRPYFVCQRSFVLLRRWKIHGKRG